MLKKNLFIFIINLLIIFNLFALDVKLDTDNDNKIDRWINASLYKKWQLLDKNKNDIADESCFYISDKRIVYFINEEKFDYSKNGKPNIWINNKIKNNNFYTTIKADENSDGKIDLVVKKLNDIIYLQKSDTDFDGVLEMEEHFNNGRKIKETIDTNSDGIMDDFYYFNGDLIEKEELDTNYDKKPDIWVIFQYRPDHSLYECLIKKDNNYDGKADEWHFTDEKRRVIRIERDKNFDGKVDDIKKFK